MIRRSWMAAGSVEATLELWASSLRDVKGRIRPLFQQARMAQSAGSAGEGTKGARLYDWAYLELADLAADEFNATLRGTWTRGLLIRRSLTDGGLAFFSTWCPAGTPIQTLVSVEGRRWAIAAR